MKINNIKHYIKIYLTIHNIDVGECVFILYDELDQI